MKSIVLEEHAELWYCNPHHFIEPKGSLSCSQEPPSNLALAVVRQICILNVPGSVLGQPLAVRTEALLWPAHAPDISGNVQKISRRYMFEAWCRLIPSRMFSLQGRVP